MGSNTYGAPGSLNIYYFDMESTKYICHLELIPTSKLVYIKETCDFIMSRFI